MQVSSQPGALFQHPRSAHSTLLVGTANASIGREEGILLAISMLMPHEGYLGQQHNTTCLLPVILLVFAVAN